MTTISPLIPLALGTLAAVLFISVFIAALAVTLHNRRVIRRYSINSDDNPKRPK